MSVRSLAKQLGLHFTTVSKALNDDPLLKPETVQRIKKAAAQAGYLPNPEISNLMSRLTSKSSDSFKAMIGYVIPSFEILQRNPNYAGHCKGIEKQATLMGYKLEFISVQENKIPVKQLQKQLRAKGIHALIFSGMEDSPLKLSHWDQFSIVTLGFQYKNFPSAYCNYYQSMIELLFQLDIRNYQKIGLVLFEGNFPYTYRQFDAAFSLYQRAISEKLHVPPLYFNHYRWDAKAFIHWQKKFRPEVVISDSLEIHSLIEKKRLKIDFAHLFQNRLFPHLAGIDQGLEAVGGAAVKLLVANFISRIEGESPFTQRMIVDAQWVTGKTIQKKPKRSSTSLEWISPSMGKL